MRLLNIPESIDLLDEQTTKRAIYLVLFLIKIWYFFKKRRKPTISMTMKVTIFILISPRGENLQSKPFLCRRQIAEVKKSPTVMINVESYR